MPEAAPEVAIDAFLARWEASGGAERANYQLFLAELCDVLAVPRPDPTGSDDAENAYVFERAVTFRNPDGSSSVSERPPEEVALIGRNDPPRGHGRGPVATFKVANGKAEPPGLFVIDSRRFVRLEEWAEAMAGR